MKTYQVNSEGDLLAIAKEIKDQFPHKIFFLIGDLGAGKTTFTKYFLSLLSAEDVASSPTFSIINEYHYAEEKFYHIDLYRLESLQEIIDIGIEDYLYSGSYCFIEWPQLIKDIVPDEHHTLEFHILEGDKRTISIR